MSEKVSETSEKPEAPIEIIAHGDGWRDVPYIRADVYESDLAERDAILAAARETLEAAQAVLAQRVTVLSLRPGDVLVIHYDIELNLLEPLHDRMQSSWSAIAKKFDAEVVLSNLVDKFSILRPEATGDA